MNPEKVKSPPVDLENDYEIHPTVCQYCVVGCGYEAHVWSGEGSDDKPRLEQGLWVSPAMTEKVKFGGLSKTVAVLPDTKCPLNKGNHSPRGGTMGRDLISVNPDGSHKDIPSVKERLTKPMIRTASGWEEMSVEQSQELIAELIVASTQAELNEDNGALKFKKPHHFGAKLFEYGSLENTYSATKFFFRTIGTPNVAFHDRPSLASNTQGFNDSGINPHGYAYADIWDSDVLLLIGNNPYENQSIFFMQQMAGKRIIVLDPRRTITADYAEKTGGLHLQPVNLGSDVAVLNSIAKYILQKRGEEGSPEWATWGGERLKGIVDLIRSEKPSGSPSQVEKGTAQWRKGPERYRKDKNQMDFEEFKMFLEGEPSLEEASAISGIPLEKLELAAQLLSGPLPETDLPDSDFFNSYKDVNTRKVSIIFEKGIIWGYNYHGTAAVANLGITIGSVLRNQERLPDDSTQRTDPLNHKLSDPAPLGVTGRAGGHQKGWCISKYKVKDQNGNVETLETLDYPFYNSEDYYDNGTWKFPTHHYLDSHLVGSKYAKRHPDAKPQPKNNQEINPDINLLWVVGANPVGQIADAAAKWKEIARRRGSSLPNTKSEALSVLKQRMQEGGLVVVQQDIYPNPTSNYADIILPAKGWGEHTFTRYNGERRLRIYSRFQDAPSTECLEDWKWFSGIAKAILARPGVQTADGLPDHLEAVNPINSESFDWTDPQDIFKEFTSNSNSNRVGSIGALNNPSTGHEPYEYLKERGTQGILLPAPIELPQPDDRDNQGSHRQGPKAYEKDSTDPFNYSFVRCPWNEIEPFFQANKPSTNDGEFYISNGRINELWNSMFTHIRNATITSRYPDDMPGTILEMNPQDAVALNIENGDVVRITGGNSEEFKGVVIIQESANNTPELPRGTVFTYFSYPVNTAGTGAIGPDQHRKFSGSGYVNNVSSEYVDPQNPIAAVKYAVGSIIKTGVRYRGLEEGVPRHLQKPSLQPRHIAFQKQMVTHESERLKWKMRELIVKIGLPKVQLNNHATYLQIFKDPDAAIAALNDSGSDFFSGFDIFRPYPPFSPSDSISASMSWDRKWPVNDSHILDSWLICETKLADQFMLSVL
ncbi:molybdopterin-dependent oxidoreductase [Ekhidna sp.]|uniref:molybdopterin-dependent oxidoreductase n=1 Tax=Ekhidna sp. TaxID=2608089 RepID=UPI003299AE62